MPVPPVRPPELRGKLFRGSQVISAGLLTRSQLRSSAWRRVFPDVWACASLALTHDLRALAAARLLLPDAVVSGRSGVPTPVAQHEVVEHGRFLARVDFAWPAHMLAVEYDGEWHGRPQQVGPDRERLNRLFAAGWRVIFATAADLRLPEQLLARIRVGLSAPTFA